MMREKIIPIIQTVLALAIIGAEKIWAPVCTGLLDLANGNQTHMKCWFSSQAVLMIALVLIAIIVTMFFVEASSRKKIQIAAITAAIIMPLTFTKVIGMCMMEGMACHSTSMWVIVLSAVIAVLGITDILKGGRNQIPK